MKIEYNLLIVNFIYTSSCSNRYIEGLREEYSNV